MVMSQQSEFGNYMYLKQHIFAWQDFISGEETTIKALKFFWNSIAEMCQNACSSTF